MKNSGLWGNTSYFKESQQNKINIPVDGKVNEQRYYWWADKHIQSLHHFYSILLLDPISAA